MYLCRLGTDEQARGPLPAQKTSLAIHVEFARQFLAFPCSTRCVRCALSIGTASVDPDCDSRLFLLADFWAFPPERLGRSTLR